MQDGVATAEAPASRKDCFGVFCTTYDLKAVSPSGLRLRWWSSSLPRSLPVCSLKCSIGFCLLPQNSK